MDIKILMAKDLETALKIKERKQLVYSQTIPLNYSINS
jgi:hypothetical protein